MWRALWIALAETEKELGIPITEEQIKELKAHADAIDFTKIEQHEKRLKHDVMAHIHAYGELCPRARAIIHLGSTSCYVTDNGDLIQLKEGLRLISHQLVQVVQNLKNFSEKYISLPTLGFTHLQPAQLTTVGKRGCLWLQDFLMDLQAIEEKIEMIPFLGAKGATGTQASFLSLFEGDHSKVKKLDQILTEKMGFKTLLTISGQTYPRKIDSIIVDLLKNLAISSHKFATDLRLLAHLKEVEEPFEKTQVGSSAMPYKRNPMLSERVCGLSRFLISLTENSSYTAATQWFERTLDDSVNRRLSLPQILLSADAILNLMIHLTSNLVVYPKVIEKRIRSEIPFIATENLLMEAVKKGGDRQDLHEKLRQYSQEASKRIKEEGLENNLLDQIASDPHFNLKKEQIEQLTDPKLYIGRASEQVTEFLTESVDPALGKYAKLSEARSEVVF